MGLSDFHKLTVTVLKSYYKKLEPKVIRYRDYRKFSNEAFQAELLKKLAYVGNQEDKLEALKNVTLSILDRLAPQKKRYVRNNQAPFINKEISKAIMARSRLLNKYRRDKTESNKLAYNKQRNYCVSLIRKQKKSYYNNLNVKNITDNALFWKTVKPCFSDKSTKDEKITLLENDDIISDDKAIADTFNLFFGNIVENLNIKPIDGISTNNNGDNDLVIKCYSKIQVAY